MVALAPAAVGSAVAAVFVVGCEVEGLAPASLVGCEVLGDAWESEAQAGGSSSVRFCCGCEAALAVSDVPAAMDGCWLKHQNLSQERQDPLQSP